MSPKAMPGIFRPKNRIDHMTLSPSCTMKSVMGMDAAARPLRRHTNHAARAIIRYKTDQTGPNIQLGGVHGGLASPAYHVGIEGVVNMEPTKAAPKHIPTHSASPMSERVKVIRTFLSLHLPLEIFASHMVAQLELQGMGI